MNPPQLALTAGTGRAIRTDRFVAFATEPTPGLVELLSADDPDAFLTLASFVVANKFEVAPFAVIDMVAASAFLFGQISLRADDEQIGGPKASTWLDTMLPSCDTLSCLPDGDSPLIDTDLQRGSVPAGGFQLAANVAIEDPAAPGVHPPSTQIEQASATADQPLAAPLDVGLSEIGLTEDIDCKFSLTEIGLTETNGAEIGLDGFELTSFDRAEVSFTEINDGEIDSAEIGLAETGLNGSHSARTSFTSLNGLNSAETSLNGADLNGLDSSETSSNGLDGVETSLNGTGLNGLDSTETSLTGTGLNGLDSAEIGLTETDGSEFGWPGIDQAGLGLPKVDLQETDLPETDLPETDLQETDLPKVDLPKVDLPEMRFPKTDRPEIDGSEVGRPQPAGAETEKDAGYLTPPAAEAWPPHSDDLRLNLTEAALPETEDQESMAARTDSAFLVEDEQPDHSSRPEAAPFWLPTVQESPGLESPISLPPIPGFGIDDASTPPAQTSRLSRLAPPDLPAVASTLSYAPPRTMPLDQAHSEATLFPPPVTPGNNSPALDSSPVSSGPADFPPPDANDSTPDSSAPTDFPPPATNDAPDSLALADVPPPLVDDSDDSAPPPTTSPLGFPPPVSRGSNRPAATNSTSLLPPLHRPSAEQRNRSRATATASGPRSADERPTDYVLVLDDGTDHQIRLGAYVGRNPNKRGDMPDGYIPIGIRSESVSRVHWALIIESGGVAVKDLGSLAGTELLLPGSHARTLVPGDSPTPIAVGTTIIFGDRSATLTTA